MKLRRLFLALLLIPPSAAFAEVVLELDGEPVSAIESIVYDAGTQRLRVILAGNRPCFGLIVPPPVGQVGLTLGLNDHALAGSVEYSAVNVSPVLVLKSQFGSLVCEPEFLFNDRFESIG